MVDLHKKAIAYLSGLSNNECKRIMLDVYCDFKGLDAFNLYNFQLVRSHGSVCVKNRNVIIELHDNGMYYFYIPLIAHSCMLNISHLTAHIRKHKIKAILKSNEK
jgi:hypothetical protein